MEGATKEEGVCSHGCGADGAEASSQAFQGDGKRKYEVFLSFRGADTRKGFIGHLYNALVNRGISTFIDNVDLEKGERVDELFRYIERSKMFVAIISQRYADSKWCLREITKIVESGRLIIPVFFGVEPSDVRNQTGPFQTAFEGHERDEELKKEVSKWKNALRVVGEKSGFNLKEDVNSHEADLIKCILKRIMKEVNPRCLDMGDYPIGLNFRVDEVLNKWLEGEVRMVGICGMGGIGKTTVAKAVYNRLCSSFEKSSFLANVREASKSFNGIVGLQEQLVHDVLGSSEVRINNKDEGITAIRRLIGDMKVLVVLDDVDHKSQLDALVGSRSEWFNGESRNIVTSRDESIFSARQKVIYRVPILDPAQSLQLFSQHAFEPPKPQPDWKGELSKKVVSIAGGIPLCLQVFGSLFSDIDSIEGWESKLEQLTRDQHEDVHERLKISYDSLDTKKQRIFLDIACFLIGWEDWEEGYAGLLERWEERKEKKEYAMLMWEGSELYPLDAIAELQRKFLIRINDKHGTFEMHDQIRDMGRSIVQQESPVANRFWENNETLKMLKRRRGTENVEAIIFHRHDQQHIPPLNTMSLRNMEKLRILDTSFVRMEGAYHDLPKFLKFLRWWRCPLKSLPIDVDAVDIVVLDLTQSNIKQFLGPSVTNLWPFGYFQPQEASYSRTFSQLKVLILMDCQNLKSTPDFRLIPNVTKLVFEGCTNLGRVHQSIGDLQSLVCLNMGGCRSLKKIPDSICRLSSLEILNLSSCRKISTLPKNLGDLLLLKKLNLHGCWSLRELPEEIGRLTSLKELQLGQGKMQRLPESVGLLTNLQELEVTLCVDLKTIPDISNLHGLRSLSLSNCSKLMDVPGLSKLRCLEYLDLKGCDALRDMNDMMKEATFEHYRDLILPGRPIASSLSKFTCGLWPCTCTWTWTPSVTVCFVLPNAARLGHATVSVEGWVPSTWTVAQVNAVRHDDSSIIFRRKGRDEPLTDPEEVIFLEGEAFVPPEDEKENAAMIRDGKGYRRIDVTFEAEGDFSRSRFCIDLSRR